MAKPDIRASFIRPNLDPQKLAHFLAVYEHGTFSAAAVINEVSQQAVSKSIARLEEALGVPLFERSRFGARPTRFADTLAKRAQSIVAEGRLAAAELAAMRGAGRGYVRIGLGWSFLARIGPEMLGRFKARHPDVTVSIVTGDSPKLYRGLLSGDLEFVVSAPPDTITLPPGLVRQPLFHENDALTMRRDHPLAARGDLPLSELRQQTWYVSLQLRGQWERICKTFIDEGHEPPTDYVDLDSILLVKSLLLAGNGVALLSPEMFALEHERELYALIQDTPFTKTRTASFTTRENAELQPFARTLRDMLHRSWQALVPAELHI